ncbi:hypothetical protein [Halorarum salinum]|nr:hypothetical protein [Halobaculum salinum]
MTVRTTYRVDLPGRRPIETESARAAQAFSEDGATVTAVSRGVEA